jgi:hypothetical protein
MKKVVKLQYGAKYTLPELKFQTPDILSYRTPKPIDPKLF